MDNYEDGNELTNKHNENNVNYEKKHVDMTPNKDLQQQSKIFQSAILGGSELDFWFDGKDDIYDTLYNTTIGGGSMTRETERISRILSLIQTVWTKYPDLRFFQLVSFLEYEYSKRNEKFGRKVLIEKDSFGVEMDHPIIDLFNLEDGNVEQFLKKLIIEISIDRI
ncbi:hypothetical protein QFZ81_000111 [Paenibacillus sp. V4I9]|uniref:hypothetical protein n=1 Tax=Paenibacillus sp. V4I9 TaxID=3042308 RepID=UPI00278B05EA|nr:hypothetical protein [Paenibacillus sp. V4I9]MDQ0885023.1 hypothetical protein [Paenibacillus sp. V4I9]